MVSIKENWTEVTGTVKSSRSSRHEGSIDLVVAVESTAPVEGFENFLADRAGKDLVVAVESSALPAALEPGAKVSLRIRRGRDPNELFAHTRYLTIHSK